jgi:SpoVK/Ycf46/Vps4 family AAA+-type ATPase
MDRFKVNTRRFDPYKNFKFRAKPLNTKPTPADVALPGSGMAILDQMVEQGRRPAPGTGSRIGALFAGGTGAERTRAAEVLADQIGKDLYRVDLSSLAGETEKHLSRVFFEADRAGAVLLFDEADALFGKRSEVKDSHDRYASIEVDYLLQRLENYNGVVILGVSLKEYIDPAFLRRLRFVVDFPFPGGERRELS